MKWAAAAGLKMGEDSRLADPATINFRWSGLPEMTEVRDTNPESLGDEYST